MDEVDIEDAAIWTARLGMWLTAGEWIGRQGVDGGGIPDWLFFAVAVITTAAGIFAALFDDGYLVWLSVPAMFCAVMGMPLAIIHALGWLFYDGEPRSQVIFLIWLFLFAPVFIIMPLARGDR